MPLRNLSLLVNIQWTTGVTRWLHWPNTLNGNIISMIKRAGEITVDFRSSKVTSGWLIAIYVLLISPLMSPIWSNFSQKLRIWIFNEWVQTSMLGSNIILRSLLTSEPSCPENCITITTLPGFSSLSFESLTFQSHSQPIHYAYRVACPLPRCVPVSYTFPYKNLSSGGQWESVIAVSSIRDVRKILERTVRFDC